MTETWVRSTLSEIVDGDEIILDVYEDGSRITVSIVRFVEMFSTVDNPTYDNLVAADINKGYTVYFNKWKELGLIN